MRISLSALRSNSWGPLALMCAALAVVMLGFSLIAYAAAEPSVPAVAVAADPGGLLGMLLAGRYLPAVGMALVVGVGLLRSGGVKIWPWLGTKLGGYVLAYVTTYALYLGTAWQAGSPWDAHLFLTAFAAALGASGVLDHWRDFLGATTKSATDPVVTMPPPVPPPSVSTRTLSRIGPLFMLAIAIGSVALPACAGATRADTLQTATLTVVATRDAVLAYDGPHELDLAKAGTPEQATASLAAYRAKRATVNKAIAAAVDAIVVAGGLNDQPSLDGVAKAIAEVIADYKSLKGMP